MNRLQSLSALPVPRGPSSTTGATHPAPFRTLAVAYSRHEAEPQPVAPPETDLCAELEEILSQRRLWAVFQPIVETQGGAILGYEGLIRGPAGSRLHSPAALFGTAAQCGLAVELEGLCRLVVLERFAELDLPGKLFLNVSPDCLVHRGSPYDATLDCVRKLGIEPGRVVIELTENQPTLDYALLRKAIMQYRALGFQIAIDDLGEGFSSLRLWSELRPEYVKIDMHFIQGINLDPVKLQFVKSIQLIAEHSGTSVIAEGIETLAELMVIRDLKLRCAQGYHLGRPSAAPPIELDGEAAASLRQHGIAVHPHLKGGDISMTTALKLLRMVPVATPAMLTNEVYELFASDPKLPAIPVVEAGRPVGLISRTHMIDRFARLYQRELYGRKSCTYLMDTAPLLVDQDTSLQDLSHLIVQAEAHHLSNGFIVTRDGQYLGIGTGHDLMREITQLQIHAARHANPLTQLPGNVPINEHIDRLLASGVPFCACYCDLDHFKPYNDVYGFRKGDDVIQLAGRILSEHCDPDRDFLGHIGGDDFMILFQSEDWMRRCEAMLRRFGDAVLQHYNPADRERGGYVSEDRQGRKVFYSTISMSIGASRIEPGRFFSHHQVAAATTASKAQAKKIYGNSLFVDRRSAADASQAA